MIKSNAEVAEVRSMQCWQMHNMFFSRALENWRHLTNRTALG